jgi:hypothetical protein
MFSSPVAGAIIMGNIFESINTEVSWNNADLIVVCVLVAFVILGLIFGAKKVAARIVGQFVAVIASLALANLLLAYLSPMSWYKNVVSALWNNAALVGWVFYILFSGAIYAILFLIWRLTFNHLIDDMKDSPVLSRIFGALLGVCDWAVLLFVTVFFLTMLPSWLGTNTPEGIKTASNYLSSSIITNKLVELFNSLISILGATPHQ